MSETLQKTAGIVCALHNADTDGVLLQILEKDPEKIMRGMELAAKEAETETMVLFIPEYAADLAETIKAAAKAHQVELVTGIVNKRAYGEYKMLHIVEAANLADQAEGSYTEGTYLSVNGGEIKKVANDTRISDLAEITGAKALLIGYRFEWPEAAELTVGEVKAENGIIRILTDKDCIVAETEKKLIASRKLSCGKCVFCREGLIQLEYMTKEIIEGRGKAEYMSITKEIGEAMCYSTPCTMGQRSAEIALSATEKFLPEYEEHIKKKNCPAGVCTSFVNIYIDPAVCSGCGDCMDVCPADCIEGKSKFIHMIDEFDCSKCGKCIDACEEGAIIQTTGKLPKLPNRLTKVGKFKKH